MWTAQYWEIILHRSLTFLHVLGAEALTAFVPDYLFKDVCIAMGLGRQRCCLPLEQSAGLFTVQCNKENIFLPARLGF